VIPYLVADNASSSSAKCGFEELIIPSSSPPRLYRKKVTVTHNSQDWDISRTWIGGTDSRSFHFSVETNTTEEYGEDCEVSTEAEGTGEATSSISNGAPDVGSTPINCSDAISWDPTTEDQPSLGCTFDLVTEDPSAEEYDDFTLTHVKGGDKTTQHFSGSPWSGTGISDNWVEVTLSDEDETADMIARAEEALEFSGEFTDGGAPVSQRDLAANELAYQLKRSKWKVKHKPTATCFLKIWLRKEIWNPDDETTTYEDLEPYVWEGTGNPCFEGEVDDDIVSDENELNEPETNGTVTVQIEKYSYLADYEPADGSESGFPQ
jgi:hypothetical protein